MLSLPIGPAARCLSSYSAQTAASAYAQIDPSQVERVFVLGPSHHVHLRWVDQSFVLPTYAFQCKVVAHIEVCFDVDKVGLCRTHRFRTRAAVQSHP